MRSEHRVRTKIIGRRRAASRACAVVLSVAMLMVAVPQPAVAVTVPVLSAPSSLAVNATASYVARATTTATNERVTSAVFTFPVNTDLSGVTAATCSAVELVTGDVYPITGVTVNAAAHTVTVNITFPKDKPTETFDITVGGVVNGSQPGPGYTYSVRLNNTPPGPQSASLSYTLSAPATTVGLGTIVLTTPTGAQNAGYTIPITLGAQGRLAGTTAAGANRIVVTFPADTDVPTAPPAGSVTIDGVAPAAVTVSGRQVTLTLAAAQTLAGGSTFNVVFDPTFGLVNPTTGGNKTLTVSTTAQTGTATSPPYAISVDFLTLTIDTTSVDFGAVDPGVTSAAAGVKLTVASSAPVTITRVLTGDVALLGLSVTGAAEGLKPAGTAIYADAYTITPPWTTDPAVALQATVAYTVTQ